mmetsp:Transcript_23525/g.54819  ORF Transcript_23525/g.54819 Transcript_23525/m.54819 type:complete len:136 (+) Transcript_23525:94-501(+)
MGTAVDDTGALPMVHLSETDQFMIMFNICAAICGTGIYCLLSLRQRQSAGQRERYFPGPFMSLAEASQSWKVYRQCGGKSDWDSHVCNFCGFAIKVAPTEMSSTPGQDLVEETKPSDKGGLKQRKNAAKKGKKQS